MRWMRKYLPHYLADTPSRLHDELAHDLSGLHLVRGRKINRIAPRGSAKTTFVSKGYPLWATVEGVEPFILLLSDSAEQSATFLDSIKTELEGNAALARDYPQACGVGPLWQSSRIRARNGVMIATKGAGGRILGLTKGHRRPTLVIVDDANETADAFSETKRRRKLAWLDKGVMPIGEPGTNFVAVGTAIHEEAIACELARRGAWESRSYRSVISWPTNTALWKEWERLYTNLADPNRGATATAFYEAHRAEMDAGTEVLWPARFSFLRLMEIRADIGDQAFDSEYQDVPGTSGATEWPPEYFDAPNFWVPGLPVDRVGTVQALDPSKGRGDAPSDWQAHVVCTLGRDGLLYFDADLRREDATRMATRAADMADIWRPNALVVEDNGTMGLLAAEFHELQMKKGRLSNVKLEIITSTDAKEFRIREVSPFLARRQVRVVNSTGGRELVRQWRQWPTADHDDAPDAAATALRRLLQAVG